MADVDIKIKFVKGSAAASAAKFKNDIKGINKSVTSLNLNLKSSSSFLKNFGANLAANAVSSLVGGISSLTSSVVSSTQELENMTTQFEVLTGSTAEAKTLLKDLTDFAASTPFRLEAIGKAASRLLSFGFTTTEVKDRLQDLGDVSAAAGTDIGELSLIFGQVRAAGKLTGERLLQFQERAIPIGPAIAKTLGVAESSIKDLVSKGGVSFADFEKAFLSLNDTGEFAFQGLIKRSQTLSGLVSTLEDNFSLIAGTMGQAVLPAVKAIITSAVQLAQSFGSFLKTADGLKQANGLIIEMADAVVQTTGFFIKFGQIGSLAFDAIKIGASFVITGFLQIAESVLKAVAAVGKFTGIDTSSIKSLADDIEAFKQTVTDDGIDRIVAFGDEINNLDDDFASVDKVTTEFSANLKKNFDEINAATKAAAESTAASNKKIVESIQGISAADRKKLEEKFKLNEQERAADDALFLAKQEAKAAQDGIVTEAERIHLMTLADERASAREAQTVAELQQVGTVQQIETTKTKIAAEQEKRRTAILLAGAKLRQAENEKLLSNTASMFGGLASLSATGGKKLFRITQGLQLAEATTSGVLAVQKAASALPFPANIPGIVAETARAAASIIRIKQASPSFEQGGIVSGNSFTGDNINARVNSGEMILNRQQQSKLFDMANNGGGGREIVVHNTIMLDGEQVGKSVSKQVANGLVLGDVV